MTGISICRTGRSRSGGGTPVIPNDIFAPPQRNCGEYGYPDPIKISLTSAGWDALLSTEAHTDRPTLNA